MAGGLEPAAEPRRRLAHALGHGAHLSPVAREQHDDAISFTELVRPDDDGLITVQSHSIAPKRRSRRWNSRTASNRSSRRKSGQSTSVNTSSLQASSHN